MALFEEVDVSDWQVSGEEYLGTKPKEWRESPLGVRWLFKEATWNPRADGSRYRKGDDWSERVAREVAAHLELPTADVELAVRSGDDGREVRGIISRSVLSDDESLIHGNELLAEVGISGSNSRDRTGYTVAAVKDSLSGIEPPSGQSMLTPWECWTGFLVLDPLIGNTDRHQENWAVISTDVNREAGRPTRRLAPSFDHASSLGFLLSDEERTSRLHSGDRNQTAAAFATRARSRFDGRPHPCPAALAALEMCSQRVKDHFTERVTALESIEPILERIPERRASAVAREFAEALFTVNRDRLLSEGLGTV